MSFSFSFSGDDIDLPPDGPPAPPAPPAPAAAPGAKPSSAFPVAGKPQLPPTHHPLPQLLARLPSKIAYGTLDVALDNGGGVVRIPRRELWDVRVQLMAEDDDDDDDTQGPEGLGKEDVKTGVYEGGFKSWESSVDLVKSLAAEHVPASLGNACMRVIELGCGTALPTLALFQWVISQHPQEDSSQVSFVVADYNPTVLQLVTLPNFILTWALSHQQHPALQDAFSIEGELELFPTVLEAFQNFLHERRIDLAFVSGGWSEELVHLLYGLPALRTPQESSPLVTLLLGAETIYSPFALHAFTETMFSILARQQEIPDATAAAYVAAKKLYFGVGGSLDDFIHEAQQRGSLVTKLREEADGVRRGVVRCVLPGR